MSLGLFVCFFLFPLCAVVLACLWRHWFSSKFSILGTWIARCWKHQRGFSVQLLSACPMKQTRASESCVNQTTLQPNLSHEPKWLYLVLMLQCLDFYVVFFLFNSRGSTLFKPAFLSKENGTKVKDCHNESTKGVCFCWFRFWCLWTCQCISCVYPAKMQGKGLGVETFFPPSATISH